MIYFGIYLFVLLILLHIVGLIHVLEERKSGVDCDYFGFYFAAFLWPFTLPFAVLIGICGFIVLAFWLWINFLFCKITGEKWSF